MTEAIFSVRRSRNLQLDEDFQNESPRNSSYARCLRIPITDLPSSTRNYSAAAFAVPVPLSAIGYAEALMAGFAAHVTSAGGMIQDLSDLRQVLDPRKLRQLMAF